MNDVNSYNRKGRLKKMASFAWYPCFLLDLYGR